MTHPGEVPTTLVSGRIMLYSVQHQVEREDSDAEDGSATHRHLLFQLHTDPHMDLAGDTPPCRSGMQNLLLHFLASAL